MSSLILRVLPETLRPSMKNSVPFESYPTGHFINHISIYEGSYGFHRNEFKAQKFKGQCCNIFYILVIPLNYSLFCCFQCID